MNALYRHFPRLVMTGLVAVLVAVSARPASAQLTQSEEERLQILTEPEAVKKKLEKDRTRVPFEFFRSQVAPFDVLPYIKANHWSTLALEMRANEEDYEGYLQTDGVGLLTIPGSEAHFEVIYRREARLMKEQRSRLGQQVLLTRIPKEWMLDLVRPGALRPDASWQASLTPLEPHQMLILILSKDATNQFSAWNRMAAMIPAGADRDSSRDLDRLRYYRLVLPMEPDKPPLSSHPLTWTTISHVIWDGLPPDVLSVSQQQAMLDWLHWGGQLILTGGAGQAYPLFQESFLGPFLPAEATGQTVGLGAADLKPLSQSYPPPTAPLLIAPENPEQAAHLAGDFIQRFGRIYQPPAPIQPPTGRPVYLAVLRPGPGSSTIALGEASPHLLAVERRVGRGRITMLALNPIEPALVAWPGIDTLVRRVILRRPEEVIVGSAGFDGYSYQPPRRSRLLAQDLTWYRIASRDARPEEDAEPRRPELPKVADSSTRTRPEDPNDPEAPVASIFGVADWRDTMRFPNLSRDLLEEASGITIPSKQFVLSVILAYLIAVVPLNWLICRFVLHRREWAWMVVPLVALGFAVGVQRFAAYDMGFDSASDEIDLIEVQGDYPRAHLSRFASLYTTGRGSYTISYPSNPTAVALPLDNGRSIRGEDMTTSVWQSYPVPALMGLSVQPRSLSLFRAEEMATLAGAIRIEGESPDRRLVNGSELELRDAVLVDIAGPNRRQERALGTIPPEGSVALDGAAAPADAARIDAGPGPDPNPMLHALRTTWEPRDENLGELRLVAWVPQAMPGQLIDPPVDRRRGYTAVVVHLRSGPPPSPDGPRYNLLAMGPEKVPAADSRRPVELATPTIFSGRPSSGMLRRPSGQPPSARNAPQSAVGPGRPPSTP